MNIINQFTLRTLLKNKVRTLVTIIGIILSTAMFTAVTISITSFQKFMVERTTYERGDWYGSVSALSNDELNDLKNEDLVTNILFSENLGYAKLEDSTNQYKPYLFLQGVTNEFIKEMPVHITDGRLPKNPTELLLPKHLYTNGGISHSLGDVLSLSLGNRVYEDTILYQHNEYVLLQDGTTESFIPLEDATYTVVGLYERPAFEDFSAPGYTAITMMDETSNSNHTYDAYIKVNNPKEIYSFLQTRFTDHKINFNHNLLRIVDGSDNAGYNGVLYGLSSILILIIMFGSISLIYNAFSISVSERTKELGLLSSIGATKRQMLRSVFFEALILSIAGFPIGILSGIIGIGITLKLSQNIIQNVISSNVAFSVAVSFPAILIAVSITLVTVLISAYIPARRVLKIPAIEAIRQTVDIHMKANKVKTSKLTYLIFRFEGMIASKNFKRNKKKYRATVLSLFMSIVLFISASSFTSYLILSTGTVMNADDYDLSYDFIPGQNHTDIESIQSLLGNTEGVTRQSQVASLTMPIQVDINDLSEEYLEYIATFNHANLNTDKGYLEIEAYLHFVDDATYEDYLSENNISKDISNSTQSPVALTYDFMKYYNGDEGKYYSLHLLDTPEISADLVRIKSQEGLHYLTSYKDEETGEMVYLYFDEHGNEKKYAQKEAANLMTLQLQGAGENPPFGVSYHQHQALQLIFPMSDMQNIFGDSDYITLNTSLFFKTTDHKIVYDKMIQLLEFADEPTYSLTDKLEYREGPRALVTLIKIFSYGFIVLISLIATANVFNTISTNISLRRREFAMLQSMGMTQKGFRRMMYFECLLYGLKGLLYGVPVSIGITYLIYRSINQGLDTDFFLPWSSIFIAISSVFLVVFVTMLYSVMKLKKENTIDALKNDVI